MALPYERRTSDTHGTGVFATRPIARGELVADYSHDRVLMACEVDDDMYVLQVGEDLYAGGARADDPDLSPDNFINHSCTPNLGFDNGSLRLHALRDVASGEELTWDYSTSMDEAGWRLACRCRSANCRGHVTAFRELAPEVQRRLLPRALSWLQQKYG